MNRFIFKVFLCVVCWANIHLPVFGQQSILSDTLNTTYARSLFLEANARQSRLNNGREYIPNDPYINGHPFFITKEWTSGSIVYDGTAFQDIKMLYDLAKDEVVVLNFLLPDKLSLVKQKVEQFGIHGHQFIYLKTDSLNMEYSGGFYDRLYHNKISVFAKRQKEVKVINNTSLDASFNQVDQYFLMKEGILYPVKTQSSVLKLLKDKKTEIQQHLRKNNIIFRVDPEKAMISMAAYYGQLSN
jgi:hypothetical protein